MKHLHIALLIAMIVALAGCGGAGSEVASIPAPPPAPPTPAHPAAAVPSAFQDVLGDESGGFYTGVSGPSRDILQIGYDPTSGTYSLSDSTQIAVSHSDVFSPANSQTGPEQSNFTYFRAGDDSLTILKDSPDNTRIALNYLSYGLWLRDPFVTNDGQRALVFGHVFTMGAETSASDVPRAGSATYNGIVDGIYAGDRRLLGSTGSLAADFGAGTVTATLMLHSTQYIDGRDAAALDGMLAGTGTISPGTSHFTGSLSGTGGFGETSGSFLGGFYGPNAIEAGFAFSASPENSDFAVTTGVFVGKR